MSRRRFMIKSIKPIIGLVMAVVLLGCTYKTVDAPIAVSTKVLPELPRASQKGKEVVGTSCNRVALLIIPVGFATAEAAYADALAQAPGADSLISYEARATTLFIFPFYYEVCSEVRGIAVSSKELNSP